MRCDLLQGLDGRVRRSLVVSSEILVDDKLQRDPDHVRRRRENELPLVGGIEQILDPGRRRFDHLGIIDENEVVEGYSGAAAVGHSRFFVDIRKVRHHRLVELAEDPFLVGDAGHREVHDVDVDLRACLLGAKLAQHLRRAPGRAVDDLDCGVQLHEWLDDGLLVAVLERAGIGHEDKVAGRLGRLDGNDPSAGRQH